MSSEAFQTLVEHNSHKSGQTPFLRTAAWMFLPFPVHRYSDQQQSWSQGKQAWLKTPKQAAEICLCWSYRWATPIPRNNAQRGSACWVCPICYPRRQSSGVEKCSPTIPGSKHSSSWCPVRGPSCVTASQHDSETPLRPQPTLPSLTEGWFW